MNQYQRLAIVAVIVTLLILAHAVMAFYALSFIRDFPSTVPGAIHAQSVLRLTGSVLAVCTLVALWASVLLYFNRPRASWLWFGLSAFLLATFVAETVARPELWSRQLFMLGPSLIAICLVALRRQASDAP